MADRTSNFRSVNVLAGLRRNDDYSGQFELALAEFNKDLQLVGLRPFTLGPMVRRLHKDGEPRIVAIVYTHTKMLAESDEKGLKKYFRIYERRLSQSKLLPGLELVLGLKGT